MSDTTIKAIVPPLLRGLLHKLMPTQRYCVTTAHNTYDNRDEKALRVSLPHTQNEDAILSALHDKIKRHINETSEISHQVFIANEFLYDITEVAHVPCEYGMLQKKIFFITGAAQGIGAGIARYVIQRGASVILGDINEKKVSTQAARLCNEFHRACAQAVTIDVSSEHSVRNAAQYICERTGGIDVLISNAGIVKPGAVETYTLEDFMKVTNVNYVGYFLLVKHFVPMMKLQSRAHKTYDMDIVQINSKSGLQGSEKNSVYAGSKFGCIGLTRSFAHELISSNIKVNAICPGNFYDGKLWSDAKEGLLKQFLDTGRVPHAKTADDVRAFYESRIPIKRGVHIEDIAQAVVYVIEQKYETGQAVPVAGGEVMLH